PAERLPRWGVKLHRGIGLFRRTQGEQQQTPSEAFVGVTTMLWDAQGDRLLGAEANADVDPLGRRPFLPKGNGTASLTAVAAAAVAARTRESPRESHAQHRVRSQPLGGYPNRHRDVRTTSCARLTPDFAQYRCHVGDAIARIVPRQ